jgi:hypothetical protein
MDRQQIILGIFERGQLLYAWRLFYCTPRQAELIVTWFGSYYVPIGAEYFAWDYAGSLF